MYHPGQPKRLKFSKRGLKFLIGILICTPVGMLYAQQAYFIDGYHGGIWGHFPYQYASFIATEMQKNPTWKVNLEIEPVTWDSIAQMDPGGYGYIQKQLSDSSLSAHMEYVNPAYGQSYMFNISGESIIRQFYYGMQTLRAHFPNITFSTYSSEEPCFTNALPGVLKSYGFKYASLKNPNTCWGGYVRPHGGELINWVGPDGTKILTVPRYESEALEKGSTWQTTAWKNDPGYIQSALAYGIKNPVGMCLQDAGWKNGPWVGDKKGTTYTTWRNYFANVANRQARVQDWALSQEDIQVSLVWGGQILQKVAKAVRHTENTLISIEAIAALNYLYDQTPWPGQALDKAWKDLLLSQHHDCWIVPYNRKYGKSWQQYVDGWTDSALQICDSLLPVTAARAVKPGKSKTYLRVYNSTGRPRTEWVSYTLPRAFREQNPGQIPVIMDKNGRQVASQYGKNPSELSFEATVPALGFVTYELKAAKAPETLAQQPNILKLLPNGNYEIQTDLYTVKLNPTKGGSIYSLVLKEKEGKKKGHEFLHASDQNINELRGYFYMDSVFHTSAETPAKVSILENGPLFARLQVAGRIAGVPFQQVISASRKDPLITTDLEIDWPANNNIGIGQYDEEHSYKSENIEKAFYNSAYKLLTLFPVNIKGGDLYRDAPFDIYKSQLKNTLYNRWDSIKNDVLLHWVNIDQPDKKYGFSLFSDATTSFAHSADIPLGLTTQYIGRGLFGADYKVDGPTRIRYAFMAHAGDWKKGGVNTASERFNNPLVPTLLLADDLKAEDWSKSFLKLDPQAGWVVSSFSVVDGTDKNDPASLINANHDPKQENVFLLRLFNAQGSSALRSIRLQNKVAKVQLVQLNGKVIRNLELNSAGNAFQMAIAPLGIATIRITQ